MAAGSHPWKSLVLGRAYSLRLEMPLVLRSFEMA